MRARRGILVIGSILACASLLALASCSPMQAEPGNGAVTKTSHRCLSGRMENTQVLDDKTLFVQDRGGTSALLHMRAACLGSMHEAVGFTFRGTDQICNPNDADITGQVTSIGVTCFVGSIEFLDKEQAKSYQHGATGKKNW